MKASDPVFFAITMGLLGLMPLLVVTTTSFLKVSVVLMLVRNALGVQQAPPNMALYGLALILSYYIMAPVGHQAYERLSSVPDAFDNVKVLVKAFPDAIQPLRGFLHKHSAPKQRQFFVSSATRLWPPELASQVSENDFAVLVPAFVVTELTEAFKIGFLLYLPFVVIDLIVSNILLALGMMMVSPSTISLPLKLFLFVMVDGWTRLIEGLVLTYV